MPPPTQRSRSTACGVGVALVLGLALIATGAQITGREGFGSAMDGAHVLRQARWTPRVLAASGSTQPTANAATAAPLVNVALVSSAMGTATAAAPRVGLTDSTRSTLQHLQPAQKFSAVLDRGAPAIARADATSCLVTKWGAVWLVHDNKRLRSHVASPTAACDLHASQVDDIERYQKSYGGVGAYSLNEAESAVACKRPGCFPRPEDEAPGGGGSEALAQPPNGWGMGAADGWVSRSGLRLNEHAQQSFAKSPPPPGEPLLLVFGGASVTDMLRNWAIHAKRVGNPRLTRGLTDGLIDGLID